MHDAILRGQQPLRGLFDDAYLRWLRGVRASPPHFNRPTPDPGPRRQPVRHDEVSRNQLVTSKEALMSRNLKATAFAMLVSAAAGIVLAAPAALAGPARIGKITVKQARLDWAPKRTSAEVAALSAQPNAAATIPTFTATVHDGASTFNYAMVGKNPFVKQTAPSTTVSTTLIPVVIKFSNGDKWDPRAIDSCDSQSALTRTQNSPSSLPSPGSSAVRAGQYIDAFQRGEFYSQTKPTGINPGYHVTGTHDSAPLVLNVPDAGAAEARTRCPGTASSARWRSTTSTPRSSSTSPAHSDRRPRRRSHSSCSATSSYTTHVAVLCPPLPRRDETNAGVPDLCLRDVLDNNGDFRSSADTAVLSHEVGEWMNDPTGFNFTKPWRNPYLPFCQLNLEVGDPLTGTGITDRLNGKNVPPAGAGVLQLVLPLVTEPRCQRMVLEQRDVHHLGGALPLTQRRQFRRATNAQRNPNPYDYR